MARAAPAPPDERRAAILAVTEQLIVAQGAEVSTRAIAEAAGIAEGTIFRVFPTKEAIIDAIFADAFDSEIYRRDIAAINLSESLEHRMIAAAAILQRRIRRVMALFAALGFRKPPSVQQRKPGARPEFSAVELTALLEPDRDKLRLPPSEAARMLLAMVMALSNPMLGGQTDATPEAIVDLLLNGITTRSKIQRTSGKP